MQVEMQWFDIILTTYGAWLPAIHAGSDHAMTVSTWMGTIRILPGRANTIVYTTRRINH